MYCDADFAGDVETCCLVSAYIFLFVGGPVTWNTTYQKVVLLSSTEAEYRVLTHVCKQAIFRHKILQLLRLDFNSPTLIHSDSQSAITIINSSNNN